MNMDEKELRKAWLRRKFSSYEYQEEMLAYHEKASDILQQHWNDPNIQQQYPEESKAILKTALPQLGYVPKPGTINPQSWDGKTGMWASTISYNFIRGMGDFWFRPTLGMSPHQSHQYSLNAGKVLRMCQNIEYTAENTWYDDEDGNDDSILDEQFTGAINWPDNWKEETSTALSISSNNIGPTGNDARCEAKQPCPRTGFWWTPAKQGSRRHFSQGETMPDFPASQYGATIWYWDQNQG